eukprot:Gregarina_sp_Poly_1__9547@NODE_600_length_7248_cov_149_324885_g463_i0_p7_GENE_NODE_600_length_7248_cov_149_324885_g463_i0NODE_600_length_7248_cov_149_324885_g463_i0_p7_ORF_typecomplete_len178_score24_48Pribosyltran/PF00156_27/3_2e19UPRTase/PF14681_6/0_039_NODE_600_length_7248_cov_149_324885_g463_i061586691
MQIDSEDLKYVEDRIACFADFPKPGILFRDFMPCVKDPRAFRILIETLSRSVKDSGANVILAPEARGFIFGCPVAYNLGLPFVAARKPGKLPGPLDAATYELEYGSTTLEVQKSSITPESKVYILDDLLATGGTIEALKKLAEAQGSQVVRCGFVVELAALEGRRKLGCPVDTIFQF